MIRGMYKYFGETPAVFIDGWLYVLIALFGALTAAFASDEAAKYLKPEALFWLRTMCGVNSAWLLALKMFRSTSYSQHQENKKADENTENIRRANEPSPVP